MRGIPPHVITAGKHLCSEHSWHFLPSGSRQGNAQCESVQSPSATQHWAQLELRPVLCTIFFVAQPVLLPLVAPVREGASQLNQDNQLNHNYSINSIRTNQDDSTINSEARAHRLYFAPHVFHSHSHSLCSYPRR